ncbi:MAG TPA: helix-turn-helix domain-containing protein [Pseudomonas sp.]|nr:helix-turn-helix domain-containing protein [Pseudomonas sp.]
MSDASAALILDTALSLAEARGWERLQLFEVADALGIGLDAIARHYPDKDALVDAWFARAEQAMLARARDEDLAGMLPAERLEELLAAWLQALEKHHALTGQMLLYKLEPGHLHLQLGGLHSLSRVVQWWRAGARLRGVWLNRIGQECLLSGLFLRTFCHWLRRPDPNLTDTRRYLRRRFDSAPLRFMLH